MARKSNVYKDKNGYYFKASLGKDKVTGKRITKTKRGFATEDEAWRAYMMFMLDFSNKNEVTDGNNSMTFKEFRDTIFLDWYKSQVKPNTYNTKSSYLLNRFTIFEMKKMNEVTPLEVQLFQNQLVSEGLSGAYVNILISLGAMVWDRAKIFDLTEYNPFREIGRVRTEKKKIQFWTLDDFQKFEVNLFPDELEKKVRLEAKLSIYEYYDFFHYLYFRFLFFTGLRYGESVTLLWENVDLQTGKIKVLYTLGNVARKKSEQYFSTPKTKSSERELFVDSRTLEFLMLWYNYQRKVGDIGLVFSHDDTFLDQRWVGKKLRSIQEKYNLPKICVHDLRHSHASLLIFLKENPKLVQGRLGHSKVEMTLGTYSHLYPNEELEVINRLNTVGNREGNVLMDVLTEEKKAESLDI